MKNISRKGMPIDFDAIENSQNKINIGIKADPRLKLQLALEAQKLELTLSEYTELILANRNENLGNETLIKKVAFYENEILQHLFDLHKGKRISYTDKNGSQHEQLINSIQDIYSIIINTVKF